jgi:hypothetical protein
MYYIQSNQYTYVLYIYIYIQSNQYTYVLYIYIYSPTCIKRSPLGPPTQYIFILCLICIANVDQMHLQFYYIFLCISLASKCIIMYHIKVIDTLEFKSDNIEISWRVTLFPASWIIIILSQQRIIEHFINKFCLYICLNIL